VHLIFKRTESLSGHFRSPQVSSDDVSVVLSFFARISPILADAKKASRHAVQTDCLISLSQLLEAILCPRILSSGRVITLLAFWIGFGSVSESFSAPVSIVVISLSLRCAFSPSPFSVCARDSAER